MSFLPRVAPSEAAEHELLQKHIHAGSFWVLRGYSPTRW